MMPSAAPTASTDPPAAAGSKKKPRHVRSPRSVQRVDDLCQAKVPITRIADVLGIAEGTLRTKYCDILDKYGRNGGNQKFHPTDAQRNHVLLMSAVGTPQEEMAVVLGIDVETLVAHFQHELSIGATNANVKVGGNLYKAATGDPAQKSTITAAIWWTKARMGWKDTSRIEQTATVNVRAQVQIILPDNGRGNPPPTIDHVALEDPEPQRLEWSPDDSDAEDDA
jgi:hypothetical protein